MFLGEDEKKDIVPISIFDVNNYYNLILDNWETIQELCDIGKDILIINPYYQLNGQEIYEIERINSLIFRYSNETILFEDEKDLNNVFKLVNKNNFEGFKESGEI